MSIALLHGKPMTRRIVLAGSLVLLAAASARAQPTIGWPETIDQLREMRSHAEACLELLRESGDTAVVHTGRIAYGMAKPASDGVIAGFTVALVEGYAPQKLTTLQANLDRAEKGLKEVCDVAIHAAPHNGSSRTIIEELAKEAVEPIVATLKAAAGALWRYHVKMADLEIKTIKNELDAAKWPEYGP